MLIPIQLPPGIERNNTAYDTPGRWYDMNLVRWTSGSMRPIGGWQRTTETPLDSTIRKIHVYRDNSNQREVLVGTDNKLYTDQGSYTDITPADFVPLSTVGIGGGYGTFNYGADTYGDARPAPSPVFSPFAYWTFGNWGEDVILTANSDGRIFYYTTSNPTDAPVVITDAPEGNNAVIVTDERHVLAIGQSGGGGSYRRIAWSSSEDYTDWDFASTTNTAGFLDLNATSPLQKGVKVREGILVFSLSDVFLVSYVSLPYIYGAQRISSTALLHPDSIATFNGNAVWLDREGFKLYSGGTVSPLDCPILNDIMAEMDPIYGPFRIHACHNGVYPEIWFFYPTAGNTEANRYVVWNYGDSPSWWGWGMLYRSAMAPAEVYRYPFMGCGDGNMFEHENGWTDAGMPRFQDIFIESGELGIGSGDGTVDVNGILAATGFGYNSLSISAFSKMAPEGDERTFGPYLPRSNGYTDTRINGRELRLRLSPVADTDWGVGKIRADVASAQGGQQR